MQAQLKTAKAATEPKFLKELAKPNQEKKKFLKNAATHDKNRQMRVSKTVHTSHGRQRSTGGNSTYPKSGVSCSKDSFVVVVPPFA